MYNPIKTKCKRKHYIKRHQLNKELAKKMLSSYYFTDRNFRIGFNINLDCHDINHAHSKLLMTPNFLEFGIEFRYNKKSFKKWLLIMLDS